MTKQTFMTIDPKGSTDLDDGFHIEKDAQGWQVSVYVACPAKGLRDDPRLLQKALKRGQTKYHAHGTTSMLGNDFEKQYSLTPEALKTTLRVHITLSETMDVSGVEIDEVEAQSTHRWTYGQVAQALTGKEPPEQLVLASRLAKCLLTRRQKGGALVFFDEERGLYLDSETMTVVEHVKEGIIGHVIIQELMILANSCASIWCKRRGCHVLWRTHEAKTEDAPTLLQNKIAQALEDGDMDTFLSIKQQMGWMSERAKYETSPGLHYGLGIEDYMHLTSPLRRAADLVSQLQILAYLNHEPLVFLPDELVSICEVMGVASEQSKLKRRYKEINKDDRETLKRARDIDEVAKDQRLFSRCVSIHCKNPVAMTGGEVLEMLEKAIENETNILGTLYELLFKSHDEQLQAHILGHIIEHPHMGIIAAQQTEQAKQWGEVIEIEEDTTYTTPLFVVEGLELSCPSKKTLNQRAHVLILARRLGLGSMMPDAWFEQPAGLIPRAKKKKVIEGIDLPRSPGAQSVSALFQWSQVEKTDLEFDYERDGELWSCVLKTTWNNEVFEAQFSAQNKNLAKQHVCHLVAEYINDLV